MRSEFGMEPEAVLRATLNRTLTLRSRMFEINVTGVFMTAQAVAKHMIAGNGGSIVLIGSMSGTIANRVRLLPLSYIPPASIQSLSIHLLPRL